MSVAALYLDWQREPRLTWAENVAAAGEAFLARTQQVPTVAYVHTSMPHPPLGCPLQWRATTMRIDAGIIRVGIEASGKGEL